MNLMRDQCFYGEIQIIILKLSLLSGECYSTVLNEQSIFDTAKCRNNLSDKICGEYWMRNVKNFCCYEVRNFYKLFEVEFRNEPFCFSAVMRFLPGDSLVVSCSIQNTNSKASLFIRTKGVLILLHQFMPNILFCHYVRSGVSKLVRFKEKCLFFFYKIILQCLIWVCTVYGTIDLHGLGYV